MSTTTPDGENVTTDDDAAGARTDVTDADGFREELIRLTEDRDANDWDTLEDRASQLLSDIRRTRPDEEGDGDE